MIQTDLRAAGIPSMDDAGRVVDLHALRHTYITLLVKAGANWRKSARAGNGTPSGTRTLNPRIKSPRLASCTAKGGIGLRQTDPPIGTTIGTENPEKDAPDPDLARVLSAWPGLSADARRAVLSIIEREAVKT